MAFLQFVLISFRALRRAVGHVESEKTEFSPPPCAATDDSVSARGDSSASSNPPRFCLGHHRCQGTVPRPPPAIRTSAYYRCGRFCNEERAGSNSGNWPNLPPLLPPLMSRHEVPFCPRRSAAATRSFENRGARQGPLSHLVPDEKLCCRSAPVAPA